MTRPVTPLPPPADWLSLRVDETMPSEWQDLAHAFVRMALVALATSPPRRMLIRCKGYGDHMRIGLGITQAVPEGTHIALRGVADRFTELSRFVREFPVPVIAEPDLLAEPAAVAESIDSDLEPTSVDPPARQLQVFDWNPLTSVTGGVDRGRHDESADRMSKAMKRLRLTGRSRPLCLPPQSWPQLLDQLEARFPNFVQVVNAAVRPHVALTARELPHRLAPVLLVGPPGIGKTYFARGLCEVLGVPPPLFISMASETNGSALGGSSTFWSNSSPGQLFESLAWGHRGAPAVANGLVVVDEVDKVSARDYNPLGALYNLLEADTAKVFVDQSLPDVTINASHLRIVCTANEMNAIPLPLRSRMLIFEIEAPSPDQATGIVLSIFAGVVERLGAPVNPSLPQTIVDEAVRVEPRQVRLLLEGAVANAMSAGRDRVEAQDWRAVRGAGRAGRRTSIGFIAQS